MPSLLLVDGSSYLYRAFHALPDLRNQAQEPTGAIHGVLSMLRRLLNDYQTAHPELQDADILRAVVFDAKGKTFRDDWFPAYKAHRPPMPDDLSRQIEPLHAAIRAQGWPLLMVEGVEADDVIGTLAQQAAKAGMNCLISTGDKDLAQLVNERITLVNTMSNETLDVAGVERKFGVLPERIVDYLTLVGDAVDGVPGVEKVGPKTAVKWLQHYGSLDEIMARAAEIKGVVGENLRRALDFLPLGRKLVTVVCDLDLAQQAADLRAQAVDKEALSALYQRLEFKTWLRELQAEEGLGAHTVRVEKTSAVSISVRRTDADLPAVSDYASREHYQCLRDWPAFEAWFAQMQQADCVALDTETTALDPLAARLVGLSFAFFQHSTWHAAYLPLAHTGLEASGQLPMADVLARLRPWLEDAACQKLGQHLKYDRHVFANHGMQLKGVIDDTLLASYVLESDRPHDLGALARRHLGLNSLSYDELTGKGAKRISFAEVAIDQATTYACEDADLSLRVQQALQPQLAAEPRLEALYRDIELPLADVLFRMERHGVLIDVFAMAAQSEELAIRLQTLEAQAHELAGEVFNLNSPKQIQEILFERLGLPVRKKTPSGQPSTNEEVLSDLALDYPLPKLLLEYRGLAKLKSTYTDKLPRMVQPATGRVHTQFSQATAITGRLASSEPNLQNIPVRTAEGRRIRSAFIAPAGHRLLSADYSQIELRIMAHLSGDARLLDAFQQGEDIHRATAAEIFGLTPLEVGADQRRAAKAINFGLIYGMSAFGLARELGIERGAAAAYMERYFTRYPGVARYMEETRQRAREQGYVETLFGRRLWLPDINASHAGRRQAAERAAINAPMQGTAADLIKKAMLAVDRWLTETQLASRMILQVHDELVLEVPESELALINSKLPDLMNGVAELKVPLLVDVNVGPNWSKA